jgi:hypothetical protein
MFTQKENTPPIPHTMKTLQKIILAFIFASCSTDDYTPLNIEPLLIENPDKTVLVDIIYVLPSHQSNKSIYQLDEANYIKNLNGYYFHRHNIGLVLGESRSIVNNELYDLKDNRGSEDHVFMKETQKSFKSDRLNIYIIKRSNTIAIAGMGRSLRVLVTDEFINESTSPHEIGHALGLGHNDIKGNIMCRTNPHLRKEFNQEQVDILKQNISRIN